jgi:hypothetical protein
MAGQQPGFQSQQVQGPMPMQVSGPQGFFPMQTATQTTGGFNMDSMMDMIMMIMMMGIMMGMMKPLMGGS